MTKTAIRTATRPLEKMLQAFPDAYQMRNGWWMHDDNPRFDFREDQDGNIGIHSWTGRTTENILSMGRILLKMSDLYAKKGQFSRVQKRDKLDLLDLAEYLLIDWRFLLQLGYSDGYVYTNKKHGIQSTCVKLGGYCRPDGTLYDKVRLRLSVKPGDKYRFLWDENTPGEPAVCGLQFLDRARQAGRLFMGEGESDGATMWFHDQPFLGVPGAASVRSLDVSLLQDIPRIYIIEEPDQVKKNRDAGQGFYKDVRSHLRDHGYTGEIFTIPWKQAMGCKDPSELHRAIYYECEFTEETVFLATVKAKFAAAIERAIAAAIPEGNTSLAVSESGGELQIQAPPPPPVTESERLNWFKELCAVPARVLSPSHKITLMVIVLYTQWWVPEQGWYRIDSHFLAQQAGMDKETFLKNLAYLTGHVGLFEKKYETIWYTDEHAPKKKCTKHLYIQPSEKAWLTYPSTYRVAEGKAERKQGGIQAPRAKCIECGSEDIDRYEAQICNACGYVHYIPLDVAPCNPDAGKPADLDTMPAEEDTPVESTARILPLEDEAPKEFTPNLPPIYTESIYNPQVGVSHSEKEQLAVPVPTIPPPDRACYPGNHRAWQWDGEKYTCAECVSIQSEVQ
jgi:hypothetical protein